MAPRSCAARHFLHRARERAGMSKAVGGHLYGYCRFRQCMWKERRVCKLNDIERVCKLNDKNDRLPHTPSRVTLSKTLELK